MLVVGDIGGTKTLMQVVDTADGTARVLHEQRYDSHAYGDFLGLARDFLQRTAPPSVPHRACFGVAGPVTESRHGQTVETTHLPWRLDSAQLSRDLGIARVLLINDFKAVGYGIDALGPGDTAVVQVGRPRDHGPRMVLGAGTGLGVTQCLWCGGHYEVFPSQGGHAGFAPADGEQTALLAYLRDRHGHVSWEDVLSGAGLAAVYEFLLDTEGGTESPELASRRAAGDAAAVIAEFGLAGRDPRARRAVEIFADVYAAAAGDLALINLAYGGVYLAGGIAPKLIAALNTPRFRRVFAAKGRMADILRDIPVAVILNTRVGLLGAVQAALRL
jgi:glucokinase